MPWTPRPPGEGALRRPTPARLLSLLLDVRDRGEDMAHALVGRHGRLVLAAALRDGWLTAERSTAPVKLPAGSTLHAGRPHLTVVQLARVTVTEGGLAWLAMQNVAHAG